jgi:hypothetical protein
VDRRPATYGFKPRWAGSPPSPEGKPAHQENATLS